MILSIIVSLKYAIKMLLEINFFEMEFKNVLWFGVANKTKYQLVFKIAQIFFDEFE